MGVKITSQYIGEKTVKNVHGPSGNEIITTAPADVGGTGKFFSPTDLMACSFGCCAVTIMSNAAKQMGVYFEDTTVEVEKIMVPEPRKVKKLVGKFVLSSVFTKEQRKELEQAAITSPVALTLTGNVELEFSFTYKDFETEK